jgi:hypothetical protein
LLDKLTVGLASKSFRRSGTFGVRIEATDSLGHTSVGHAEVRVKK